MIFLIHISLALIWGGYRGWHDSLAGIHTLIPAAVKVYMSVVYHIIWDVNRILIATT
jgi:hypothetical protein